MLHRTVGSNRYCGPGALAALTGHDTGETAKVLRTVTGKRAIIGVSAKHFYWALVRLNPSPVPMVVEAYAHRSLEFIGRQLAAGRYAILLTGHYCALEVHADGSVDVCDNMTVYPLPLLKYRRRRKRVVQLWRIYGERHPMES